MKQDWESAVTSGDVTQIQSLLDSGSDINSLDRYGQTALMLASHKGYTEIVSLLASRGAALNHTAKYGLSALMLAVIGAHPEVVQTLIEHGADTTLRTSPTMTTTADKTALELADQLNRKACLDILKTKEA